MSSFAATLSDEEREQREILMELFTSCGGPGWRRNWNWGSVERVGLWDGVTTDADGRVIKLDLANNQLSGSSSSPVE